jgi:DNA-binding SARP family transcriptional activator/tetratricopeptide (TPR) repeat protein/DNA-binding XRE family transcriptional regulator
MERIDRSPAASLGELLRGYRHAAGLTQQELAMRADVSLGALRDLEQGRRRQPRPGSLARLASGLGLAAVDAEELERAATGDASPAGGPAVPGEPPPGAGAETWLAVLGPLAAWRRGEAVAVGGPGRQAVLGLLAVAAGSLVHREAIIDALWPDDPPRRAVNVVQAHVGALRRILDPDRGKSGRGVPNSGKQGSAKPGSGKPSRDGLLITTGRSYQLRAGAGRLDLAAFREVAGRARAAGSAGDDEAACGRYEQALALWRGEPLANVDLLRGHPTVVGLAREHADTVIEYARAASAAGWHDRVLAPLRELADRDPLNEQAHAQLMIALAGSGQRAESLAVYSGLRRRLDEELAVAPGPYVAQAYQRVLRQDIPGQRASAALIATPAPEPVVPRQLPPAPLFFTGRRAELAALRRLLAEGAGTVVVTAIGGTAGVGKTALAVHWAQQVATAFPHGQLYVNLQGFGPSGAPVQPGEALRGFLHALGVPPSRIPAGLQAQAGLYRSVLAGRRVLVVLDNAQDAEHVRPLLPGTPGCLAVVTSRARLAGLAIADGAHLLTLDVLDRDEARQLLAGRLGAARVAAEPAAVDELIGLCARLPLALAIAAGRAAASPGHPLSALAAELADATGRIDNLDVGDRATSIREVFSWSSRQLSAPTARMFRLLGLHPGPDITPAAAASLAATSPGSARQALRELTAAHLIIEHQPGRYTFHDLLRAYAADEAHTSESADDRRAAIARTLDHYLHSARAAVVVLNPSHEPITVAPSLPGVTPEQPGDYQHVLEWFQAEHQVLAAAAALAANANANAGVGACAGFDAYAWQLPCVMHDFCARSGHWQEQIALLHNAMDVATRLGDTAGQAAIHQFLGHTWILLTDYRKARENLSRCLGLYRRLGNRGSEACALLSMGWLAECEGRYHRALSYDEQGLALFRSIGEQVRQAVALNNAGGCHAKLGHYRQAVECCLQALDLHRRSGDRNGEAIALQTLGRAEHGLGRVSESDEYYRQALSISTEVGSRLDQAEILTRLGDSHHARGDALPARQAWQQALVILDDLHRPGASELRDKLSRATPAPSPGPA